MTRPLLSICILFAAALTGTAGDAQSAATRQLVERNAEFEQDIIRVSESVYTAVGYAVSPVSMIVGEDGVVIVDTGISAVAGRRIRDDFRQLVDKPIKAIIFTHGHPDHIGGASAFMEEGTQVWAQEGFGSEQRMQNRAGLQIQGRRGAMQAGFLLSPEQRINNGVAKAFWPERATGVFSGSAAKDALPLQFVSGDGMMLRAAGLELELLPAGGETDDHLIVWLPSEKVAFAGDNFYKSWPNLSAIRGTPYRDVQDWILALQKIIDREPNAVVGGHTRPVIGRDTVREVLTNYRDAIRFVFDKTIEGMNKGLGPDALVDYVKLPEEFAELDYLQPYYGNVEWSVRGIFSGYLGWFDGNASNLFPLSIREEANRVARLAGGSEALSNSAREAFAAQDYQWAAQLCDYLLALNADDKSAMLLKADALEKLAEQLLTATGRNYYLTSARFLRERAQAVVGSQPMVAPEQVDE